MATARTLRIISILSFLPAFPLCIAHAARTNKALPAVGLIPLFFSSGFSAFLVSKIGRGEQGIKLFGAGRTRHGEEGDDEGVLDEANSEWLLRHRILVFVADTIFATSLLTVLICTWLGVGTYWYHYYGRGEEAYVAAYATVPLLTNFIIHILLATQEFIVGTGLGQLIGRLYNTSRSQDACPHCGEQLHHVHEEDSPLTIPWFRSATPKPAFKSMGFQVPADAGPSRRAAAAVAAPKLKGKGPAWMRGRQGDPALDIDEDNAEGNTERYTDALDDGTTDAVLIGPDAKTGQ